jgi:hypothetical protein
VCGPAAVPIITLAFTAAAGVQQYESQKAEARYNEAVENDKARIGEAQAEQALQLGNIEEDRQRARVRAAIGSQRVALAANNIDTSSGTALDLIGETAQFGEEDALAIRANAAREAWGYKVGANDSRNQAKLTKAAGKNKSTATLLNTGAQLGSQGYSYFGGG